MIVMATEVVLQSPSSPSTAATESIAEEVVLQTPLRSDENGGSEDGFDLVKHEKEGKEGEGFECRPIRNGSAGSEDREIIRDSEGDHVVLVNGSSYLDEEVKGVRFESPLRRRESMGRSDDLHNGKLGEKGSTDEDTELGSDVNFVKGVSFEGGNDIGIIGHLEGSMERIGQEEDEKFEGGDVQHNGGWTKENADVDNGKFIEKTGWNDNAIDLESENKVEGGEGHENSGWERDANHEDTGREYSESLLSTGWEDDACVEKGFDSWEKGENGELFRGGGDYGDAECEYSEVLAKESGSFKEEKGRQVEFPLRDGEPDCSFYLRTGNCSYGSNCKFNHPPNRTRNQAKPRHKSGSIGPAGKLIKELPERAGQTECKFYSKNGSCKLGSTCRFSHHGHYQEKTEEGHVELNFSGLPLRPGQKECDHYMRTGSCNYSINCRFHHPNPAVTKQDPFYPYENCGSQQLASGALQLREMSQSLKMSNEPLSFSNASPWAMLFPPQRLNPTSDWDDYEPRLRETGGSIDLLGQMDEYPQRPGEAECSFFNKFRTCKYKSACKFHHPLPPSLTDQGYPIHHLGQMDEYPQRPGEAECSFFNKFRTCKYKSACKFHHPLPPSLSDQGYPIHHQEQMDEYPQRPGEPECSHFLKSGKCKYKSACRFHHPSPSTSSCDMRNVDGPVHHAVPVEHPERPGEPVCTHFVKFGNCKFGAGCKYHHPNRCLPRVPSFVISPNGLPLRSDQPPCSHYSRFGICKFGPMCKFDHPMN